jgi:protein-disulfide isomerase
MRHRYTILIALIVVMGLFALWVVQPEKLSFRPTATPEGFRELVLQTPSSRPDMFLAGLPRSYEETSADLSDGTSLSVCDALFHDPASPAVGSAESALIIVEFFDYQCPYCKTLSVMLTDIQESEPRVRVIYKDWPILSKSSELAARAALAAANQEKYIAFHRRIMMARLIPTPAYIEEVSKKLGLDLVQLRKDMAADETTRALRRNARLASALGLIGTPVLVVGRTIVQGAITRAQLDRLIEIELQTALPRTC